MGIFSINMKGTREIIDFLKRNYQDYEDHLIQVIELSSNGFYFINENKMYFSDEASKILNIEQEIEWLDFIEHVNVHDREQFGFVDTSYELTYRYHLNHEKTLWIKEHGLFDFNNKNQRLAIIKNYSHQQDPLLEKLAYYDPVTQLKNRNYFEKDANYLIQYQIPFALFLLDINSFKLINDNFGHSLGDEVLRKFSEKLRESITYKHHFDMYRLSGDEFFIVFPYLVNKEETLEIVNHIINRFEEYIVIRDYKLTISPSIGISFYPNDTDNLQTLIKYADISMYQAKFSDYHSYSFFDPVFYKQVLEEESIEEHIKYLIDHELIDLYFQPIYNIQSNQVTSFEALFKSRSNYSPEKILALLVIIVAFKV